MSAGFDVVSFRGRAVNDGSIYRAHFIEPEGGIFNTFGGEAIENERPYNFPVFVRVQPDGIRFAIEVHMLQVSQANLDQLKMWWSPEDDPGYLIVDDNMGETPSIQRRIECVVEKLIAIQVNVFKVEMRASTGVWESNSETSIATQNIVTDGQTFSVPMVGTARTYPKFVIEPKTLLTNASSWIKRRSIVVANRSELPLIDHAGVGYPLLLVDLSSISVTPGNDVRVLLNGVDQPRWIQGNKLWAHLQFRPRRTFTIADALDSSELGTINVSNSEGLSRWSGAEAGYFLIDNEAIQYESAEGTTLTSIKRGALGTTAASHSPGATGYWIEHPNLYLIWDYSFAQAPEEPDNLKPVIDLANSTNLAWVWPGPFFNAEDARSATWRKEFIEDNVASQYIIAYDNGSQIVLENNPPQGLKVRSNNAILDIPCGISTLALTQVSSGGIGIPVEGYGYRKIVTRTDNIYTIEQTGLDSLQTALARDEDGNLNPIYEDFPTYEAIGTGTDEVEVSNTFVATRGADSERHIYRKIQVGSQNVVIAQAVNEFGDQLPIFVIRPVYNSIVSQTTQTTYSQEKGIVQTITSGMTFRIYGVDRLGNESLIAVGATGELYGLRLNVLIPIGEDLEGEPFSEAPDDVEDGTGANTTIDNITVTFISAITPKIVLGSSTENMYLAAALRIQNDTTGDYLDITVPMLIDEQLEIDCLLHTIRDITNDRDAIAHVVASNFHHWLYNRPGGSNTYSVHMDGIGGGNGNMDIDATFRTRWL